MKPGLSCAGAEFGMQDAGVLHEALQIAVVLARTWMSKPLLNRPGDPRVAEKSSAGDGAGYPWRPEVSSPPGAPQAPGRRHITKNLDQ
jgi:hypothetical protein